MAYAKVKEYFIAGKVWTAETLMEHCKIAKTTARQRLQRYCRGEICEKKVLHIGAIPTGGYVFEAGTEEYRALQDRRPRPENLKSPNPTKYERQLMGGKNGYTQI